MSDEQNDNNDDTIDPRSSREEIRKQVRTKVRSGFIEGAEGILGAFEVGCMIQEEVASLFGEVTRDAREGLVESVGEEYEPVEMKEVEDVLPQHIYSPLKEAGIHDVGDLTRHTAEELLDKVDDFDEGSLDHLEEALDTLEEAFDVSLELADEEDDPNAYVDEPGGGIVREGEGEERETDPRLFKLVQDLDEVDQEVADDLEKVGVTVIGDLVSMGWGEIKEVLIHRGEHEYADPAQTVGKIKRSLEEMDLRLEMSKAELYDLGW